MAKSGPGVVKAFQEASEEDRKRIVDGLPYDVGRLKPPAEHRFKKGNKSVAMIEGDRTIGLETLTIEDVTQRIEETEDFLQKLTGFKVEIEQVG